MVSRFLLTICLLFWTIRQTLVLHTKQRKEKKNHNFSFFYNKACKLEIIDIQFYSKVNHFWRVEKLLINFAVQNIQMPLQVGTVKMRCR